MTVAPYGSWRSPVALELIAAGFVRLAEPRWDGDAVTWLEGRAEDGGRQTLVRWTRDGGVRDVSPAGINVRTRVHEYGGAAYLVADDLVVVSDFAAGRLLRVGPDRTAAPLTPDGRWRYADVRRSTGRLYWPVSLLGVHLMPTAMVFGGCLSLWPALVVGRAPLSWLDGVAVLLCTVAIACEAIADRQLHEFRRSGPPPGAILDRGLWGWSRHPNYFGEITLWWGLFAFGLAAAPGMWWPVAGPVAITLLFTLASIPMIEKRMHARRSGWAEHCRRVSVLVPWPPRRAARRHPGRAAASVPKPRTPKACPSPRTPKASPSRGRQKNPSCPRRFACTTPRPARSRTSRPSSPAR